MANRVISAKVRNENAFFFTITIDIIDQLLIETCTVFVYSVKCVVYQVKCCGLLSDIKVSPVGV